MKERVKKGIMVSNGNDRFSKPLSLFEGDKFYCKVSGKDTEGDLYIFDSTRLKEGGPPLHFHYNQDEWWYIISGEYLIKVGEEVNRLDYFFEKISVQYTEEVEYRTNTISSLLEPFIIIFLGLIVGVILIAMYLPMFQMSNSF